MRLASPVLNLSYSTLPDLLRAINERAGPEGYAVVLQRTKKSRQKSPEEGLNNLCLRKATPHPNLSLATSHQQ